TYARNLARAGEGAFIPGVPSTGSTSILWTFVLAPGYLLPAGAYVWTQLAGFASRVAAALGAARAVEDAPLGLSLAVGVAVALAPRVPPAVGAGGVLEVGPLGLSLAVGLAGALGWHGGWAAGWGLETGSFAALLGWFWHWRRRRGPRVTGHRWQDGLRLGVW